MPSRVLLASDTAEDATPGPGLRRAAHGHPSDRPEPGRRVGRWHVRGRRDHEGRRVPDPEAANIAKSFGSTLQAASRASQLVSQRWPRLSGLVFHEREDWSFYGTVLEQGETITFGGLDLDAPGRW